MLSCIPNRKIYTPYFASSYESALYKGFEYQKEMVDRERREIILSAGSQEAVKGPRTQRRTGSCSGCSRSWHRYTFDTTRLQIGLVFPGKVVREVESEF